ncbi:hypothetical protein ACFL49_00095 [Candidatus Omnitrophota bacterium]
MKKTNLLFACVMLSFLFIGVCMSQESDVKIDQENNNRLSACEKAGGTIKIIKECDGSESDWCDISEKEQCYADQVEEGGCTVGEYSEELGGITGISPRVFCDGLDNQ